MRGEGLRSDKVGRIETTEKAIKAKRETLSLILDKLRDIDVLGARKECLLEDIMLYKISWVLKMEIRQRCVVGVDAVRVESGMDGGRQKTERYRWEMAVS